jgi:hypothetical protein
VGVIIVATCCMIEPSGGVGAAAFAHRCKHQTADNCVVVFLWHADAVPKAQEQIQATMLIAADIETFVKQTLGV